MSNLRVFGSVTRGQERPDSDVDLLADLPAGMGLMGLGRVQDALEAILGASLDLIPARDLKPAVRARVERDPGGAVTYRDRERMSDIVAAVGIRTRARNRGSVGPLW